jgi:hypothetical protein
MALSFFLLLTLGHVIGDFVLQPYWLVVAKRSGWRGLSIHVGVVTFVTAILVWGSIPNWWVWVIVLFIGHLFIDQFRTFIFTDNTKGKGLLLLIMDQMAHLVLIALIAWAATGWTLAELPILLTSNALSQQRLMAYFIGLAIMIGVVPVFEAEITVAAWAAGGHEVDKTVEIAPSDRIFGGIERIAAMTLVLTNYWLLLPLIFLPRLVFMIRQGLAKTDRTALISKVATSFIGAVIVSSVLYNVPAPLFNL